MSGSAKLLVLACALMALSGCARLGYYAHLGKGGIGLVTRGSRVEKLLRDPNTSEGLKNRLDMASEMLDFADNQLGLGVKKQYRKYIDLSAPTLFGLS